jgi:alanine dehydrogenase
LRQRGHEVVVETGAGVGSTFPDAEYEAVGARVTSVDDVWASSDMVLKVKEPLPVEYDRLRDGQILFTYLHLAADDQLTRALMASGATCVAYETVETDDGKLPLLAPMSEVAGRLATQMGAWALEKAQGGRGILLGGVPGVPPAKVVVLGGGIVGYNAALIAVGMQADVWILDRSVERMRDLEMMLDGRITLAMSNRLQIEQVAADADLIIGAVLIPGARAPKLITRDMLGGLKPGAVLVDVAIDQGGCFETSRPTTHSDPIYEVDGIVHYCVANMPGAVPATSTFALTNVTLPYVEAIADHGIREAVARDPALGRGVNIVDGKLTYQAVADACGLVYSPLEQALPLEPVA